MSRTDPRKGGLVSPSGLGLLKMSFCTTRINLSQYNLRYHVLSHLVVHCNSISIQKLV